MFLLVIAVLGVLAIVLWDPVLEKKGLEPIGLVILVIAGISLFIGVMTYPKSLNTIVNMEAFYNNNFDVYEQGIKKYPDSAKTTTGDATTTVYLLSYDMIKKIVAYNYQLAWYKKYQEHWLLGGFVGKIPDNLEFIKIE